MLSFVGLHTHSDYSLLDGASQLPELVEQAVKLGMSAIALTDHGVMYGAIELIKLCRIHHIKPIVGNEMYVINGDIHQKRRYQKYHQVVLAKNNQGYKNLVKLTTISHLKGVQGKGIMARPCINKELLSEYREGLIVTSACLGGEVPQWILRGKLEEARKVAQWYKDTFGEDYYLEIQDHGSQEDRVVNVEIVKISRELDIKIIATNDSHFTSCYDVEAHDALLCIQTGKQIIEDNRMRYSGTEYLKSAEEMAALFRDHLSDEVIREAIDNTVEIANKVQSYNVMDEPRLPNYPIPSGHTADTYLEEITWKGLLERFNCRNRGEISVNYKERLDRELKIIQQMGFSTYILVVWDYIKYARDNAIPVGPGRGSAAGSLVAYSLKITNIDPVHHGLLFERFLNPERKSMPDIDTDFCIDKRNKVIEYVTQKYGADRVAQIITFNRMAPRAALKDVARVLGIPYGEADKMAKLIPVSRGKPTPLKEMISDLTPVPEFKAKYDNDPSVQHWLDMAIRIEGTNKTFGVHAAGVVISSEPLDEVVPLQMNNDGSVITQYFMEDLESLGLLKMDFLGLKNLTTIQNTVELIKKTRNQTVDPDRVPIEERKAQRTKGTLKKVPEDIRKTYEILGKGDLEGIFQLESSGMRQIVRELAPDSIEDISSILALYRPGPLDAGLIPKFINRKHGREALDYAHPLLEPILKETYAVLVYQEQIMKVAQDLAGYSLGQADLLRRAMGKKKASEMQKQRETFIDGATRNGVSQKAAYELFEQMVLFAEYCFNKSHSTAYAYVTYQTAYLKANYSVEYMAALLTANGDDQDKIKKYIEGCLKLNINVEPPDINSSEVDFTPSENKILFGLSAIRNVGQAGVECILAARERGGAFKSLADLCDRVNLQTVNSRALESLIKCGAFDKIEANRKKLTEHLHSLISWAQSRAKDREIGQLNLFDLPGDTTKKVRFESAPVATDCPDFTNVEKLQMEKELLGFFVSDHPLKAVQKSAQLQKLDPVSLINLEEHRAKTKVITIVMVTEIKLIMTKNGDRMAFLQIEDLSGKAEAIVFPKIYEKVALSLVTDVPVIIEGKKEQRDEDLQLIVENMTLVTAEQLVANEDFGHQNHETNQEENLFDKQEYCLPMDVDQIVIVEMTPEQVNDDQQIKNLSVILSEFSVKTKKAKIPVVAMVATENLCEYVCFGEGFWVENQNDAVAMLKGSKFNAKVHKFLDF